MSALASLTAVAPPLARDSDFQAAWYYSMVLFAAIAIAGWGVWMAARQLGRMWRHGDHGLALTVGAVVTVSFLMFVSMLITVAIAMLPVAYRGGAG